MSTRFDACVSAVATEGGLDPDRVATDKLFVQRVINDTREEIYSLPTHFKAQEFQGEIVGIGNVTAGTVSVTQNQAEVTGSSTAFTTAMSGRYISINSNPWQRISYVTDTTHLTLESGWPADTLSAKPYIIWKRHYALPPKVKKILRLRDMTNSRYQLTYQDPSEFYALNGFGDTFSDANCFTQFSTTDYGSSYLESTIFAGVATTANCPIVDFTSVGLVTAMAAGDMVKLGNSTTSTAFYVDKVLTDTKIALRENVGVTLSSQSATAMSLDRLNLQVYPSPNVVSRIYFFEALKNYAPLVSPNDLLEEGWYPAIKAGSVAKIYEFVRDPRAENKKAEYEGLKRQLIRDQFKAENPQSRFQPYIRGRHGDDWYFSKDSNRI